ncbi:hypothetical protein BSKO_04371 [Bryopsis sp. KO-2023]|nr:hypothetical protein BSKO_04371 [Bryopsis sp. KO-2023]
MSTTFLGKRVSPHGVQAALDVYRPPGRAPSRCRRQISVQAVAAPSTSLGESIRQDFPLLDQEINGKKLVYFDNAATSQKPQVLLDSLLSYYSKINSNVHRGVHTLSAQATTAYEGAREKVAKFINAASPSEIVYTRNASEAINLVAYGWGLSHLKPGDEIILSVAEHHSNTVPWQMIAEKTGAQLKHVKLTEDTEEFDMKHFRELLSDKTKLVTTVHISNMLGSVSPAEEICETAHRVGAKVLLDCCQSVPNRPVDVQELGADWIVASGHKMCGPTGCGFLWGKYSVLEEMEPFMGGGEMIQDVFLDHSTFAPPPGRFEAGTPAIAEAIGLGAACDYLSGIGMDKVQSYEEEIGGYLYEKLSAVDGLRIYGPPPSLGRASLCSFNVEGLHATDLAAVVDQQGVAIRSGHHCTQPLHRYFDVSASARASLYLYNTTAEVDTFVDVLEDAIKFFRDAGM